jgi:hypothetical protein
MPETYQEGSFRESGDDDDDTDTDETDLFDSLSLIFTSAGSCCSQENE